MNRQADFIFEELKRCSSKSAWIVPTYVGKKFVWALYNENSYAHVGSQSFNVEKIRLVISGMVPIQVIKNFAAALESGILEWLQNLISMHSLSNIKPDSSLVKPSMKGNIIVLFVIWTSGMIVASIISVVEMYKLIYLFIRICFGYLNLFHFWARIRRFITCIK